jgi:hypothetical protein
LQLASLDETCIIGCGLHCWMKLASPVAACIAGCSLHYRLKLALFEAGITE